MIQTTLRGMRNKKRVPTKVMWYFPLIPRLKHLFMNKTNAKLMRWHKEEYKQDNMLRHPADGSQWRKVDRTFPIFANDARNIRFGLSTDGMNLFGEQSSGHYLACDILYIQSSSLVVYEAEIHSDAGACPRPEATR